MKPIIGYFAIQEKLQTQKLLISKGWLRDNNMNFTQSPCVYCKNYKKKKMEKKCIFTKMYVVRKHTQDHLVYLQFVLLQYNIQKCTLANII